MHTHVCMYDMSGNASHKILVFTVLYIVYWTVPKRAVQIVTVLCKSVLTVLQHSGMNRVQHYDIEIPGLPSLPFLLSNLFLWVHCTSVLMVKTGCSSTRHGNVWRYEGIGLPILNLVVGCGKWLALRSGRLTPLRKNFRYLLHGWLGRHQSRSGQYGDKSHSPAMNPTNFFFSRASSP